MESSDFETKKFKVVLLGSKASGKSCVANYLTNQIFYEEYVPTIGTEFFNKVALPQKPQTIMKALCLLRL